MGACVVVGAAVAFQDQTQLSLSERPKVSVMVARIVYVPGDEYLCQNDSFWATSLLLAV